MGRDQGEDLGSEALGFLFADAGDFEELGGRSGAALAKGFDGGVMQDDVGGDAGGLG
jgi:hypothetical protein